MILSKVRFSELLVKFSMAIAFAGIRTSPASGCAGTRVVRGVTTTQGQKCRRESRRAAEFVALSYGQVLLGMTWAYQRSC